MFNKSKKARSSFGLNAPRYILIIQEVSKPHEIPKTDPRALDSSKHCLLNLLVRTVGESFKCRTKSKKSKVLTNGIKKPYTRSEVTMGYPFFWKTQPLSLIN